MTVAAIALVIASVFGVLLRIRMSVNTIESWRFVGRITFLDSRIVPDVDRLWIGFVKLDMTAAKKATDGLERMPVVHHADLYVPAMSPDVRDQHRREK